MKVRFVIDNNNEMVECIIDRPEVVAKKLANYRDNYADNAIDELCNEVPSIVKAVSGKLCSGIWYFAEEPEIVK